MSCDDKFIVAIKNRYTPEALKALCTGHLLDLKYNCEDYRINTLDKFIELYADLVYGRMVTTTWDDWCEAINLSYIETKKVTVVDKEIRKKVDREIKESKEFFRDA